MRNQRFVITVVIVVVISILAAGMAQATPGPEPPALLQFRAGGHILGFGSDTVYLAALDHALSLTFVGAGPVTPRAEAAGGTGSAPEGAGAPPLGRVTYPELWPGISLAYEAAPGSIVKSTYTLAPGADSANIQLRYNVPVSVAADGSLSFAFETGRLRESAPVAWQEIAGRRIPVPVAFRVIGETEVGFAVGVYDPDYALTIDPAYHWHTFYGGSSNDYGQGIAVDGSGNLYIVGSSQFSWHGPWNGSESPAPLNAHSGGDETGDLVVIKLNSSGTYQWHTFYGSSDEDEGHAVAVDGSGQVYVTGYSQASWTGPGSTAPLNAHSGGNDLLVLKLDSSGTYQWHTFYGGSDEDEGHDIAVDSSGQVYVAGSSQAGWTGPGSTAPLNAHRGGSDLAVLKLASSGAYQWHTFYGGGDGDEGHGVAVDGSGDVYVAGSSQASWDGPGSITPLNAHRGGSDLAVVKLAGSGAYQWHTFYGSSGEDYGQGIAVDGSQVYVTGSSTASWDGPGSIAPLNAHRGGSDLVVVKLAGSGTYQWHTFYGGSDDDVGRDIALDSSGQVYVTGQSQASWTGPGSTAPRNGYRGESDLVVVKLGSSGVYQWHTFYGNSLGQDAGHGIAVEGDGDVYVTGPSRANWQGPGDTYPLNVLDGSYPAILALKLNSSGSYRWHTFYGGSSWDVGFDIAVDGSGNVYVTGYSYKSWNGPGDAPPLNAHSGGYLNIVVIKLDSSGAYRWHTFYGSSSHLDQGLGIAVDGSGDVYVTGYSYGNWDGPGGVPPLNAQGSIVVIKLDSSGTYQWHTFHGSNMGDEGRGIAVDGSGHVYVAGYSWESWDGPGGVPPLNPGSEGGIVVLKLDSNGTYQWHTFYGGISDAGWDIVVDGSGGVYATGVGGGWTGPGGVAPLNAGGGGGDIVVVKLDSSGAYQWHTFYGGSDSDQSFSIAVDGSGNLYVTGSSQFSWNGPGGTAPLNAHSGGQFARDIVVVKLASSGAYQWHTFYGNSEDSRSDIGRGIAVDGSSNVYVTGDSGDWNGPGDIAPLNAHSGDEDIVALKLDSSGSYQWHTFYGGSDGEGGLGIAVDDSGSVYVTGYSWSWVGPGSTAPLNAYRGDLDIVVVKTMTGQPEMAVLGNNQEIASGSLVPSEANHTDFGQADAPGGTVTRTFIISNSGTTDLILSNTPAVTLSGAGAVHFNLTRQPDSPVKAGETTSFEVQFAPTATGTYTATVSIANNDGDENPYTFAIQGQGDAPEMAVLGNNQEIASGSAIPSLANHTDFGRVNVSGGTMTRTFTISNNSTVDLILPATSAVTLTGTGAAHFNLTRQPDSPVRAGDTTSFEVQFAPTATGIHTATANLANNDETPYTFVIQGWGGRYMYLPLIVKD